MATPGASPQTDNGFVMIANEVFDALINFRICGEHRQILDFIIRKTWGFKKKTDAIPLSQFVKATGIQKPHVARALNSLQLRGLISVAKMGNGGISTYGFIKDYTKWKPLPKRATLPKKAIGVAKKGNKSLPKKAHSKETTKETYSKEKKTTAFPQGTGEKAGPPEPPKPPKTPKTPKPVEPFYLTKKKRKLKGWKLETFELYWKTFHWFKDKANAADAWLQIPGLTQELAFKQIIPAAARYCAARPALIADRHTPKWAQGWLSSRRWEDEKYEDEKDGLNDFLRRHGQNEKVV